MKKQIALALTAALLTFPVAPVMADTTSTGTTSVTTTTTQPSNDTTADQTTSATTTTGTQTSNTDATTSTDTQTSNTGTTTSTDTNAENTNVTVQDQNGKTVDPGTLPDSPLYWFETLIQKVQVALTFDPMKKAQVIQDQADENLAEADALVEKGDLEEAEKTLTVYSEKVDEAQAFLDQVKDPNSETAQKVQAALTKVNTNNIIVLGGLLEKLPPQAAQKIALNIVRSLEKAVAKADKMGNAMNNDGTTDTTTTANGTTTDTTSTMQTASVDNTTNVTDTDDQALLKKQAKAALQQFQIQLGLKKADHTPNGNAYGYYKNMQAGDDEDSNKVEEDNESNENTTNLTQPQQKTQVQRQVKPSEKASVSKERGDQEKNNHSQKDEKGNAGRD